MAFKLDSVVPWGRSFDEYRLMFLLDEEDSTKQIAGFGDGPASFNYEATANGWQVTSFDPVYQFTKEQLGQRIEEVRITVMQQMEQNKQNYVWTNIKSLSELEQIRMSAMNLFLSDYENGIEEGRYIYYKLPEKLPYEEDSFDIGLSSHFLLMYTALGYEFHIKAISEMLRVCKEVRIFPMLDLDSKSSDLITSVIHYFKKNYKTEIKETAYEFQKGGNRLLIISK